MFIEMPTALDKTSNLSLRKKKSGKSKQHPDMQFMPFISDYIKVVFIRDHCPLFKCISQLLSHVNKVKSE